MINNDQKLEQKLDEIAKNIYQIWSDSEDKWDLCSLEDIKKDKFCLDNIVDMSAYLYEAGYLDQIEEILWDIIYNKFKHLLKEENK